jgi:predicted nuclease with TOPRIM domain
MTDDPQGPPVQIEDIEDGEDVKSVLRRLEEGLTNYGETVSALYDRIKALEQENQRLREELDELNELSERFESIEGDVRVAKASANGDKREKVENLQNVIKHAYTDATGGPGGVKVDSGEVAGLIEPGRQTALNYMDELAGAFDWCETETPGGPQPKQLRVDKDAPLADRLDAIASHFAGDSK